MVTCANGHANQLPGGTCLVCGLALPTPGMQVWGAPEPAPTTPLASQSQQWPAPTTEWRPPGPLAPGQSEIPSKGLGRRSWLIVGVVAAVFAVAVASTYFILTKPIPAVVGLDPTLAMSELAAAGFADVTTTREFSETVPRGLVASQSPAAGARARSGEPVALAVSRGQAREVPIVTGLGLTAASRELAGRGLDASTTAQESDVVPEGVVISQFPEPGSLLEQGDQVSLIISSGPPYTTVTVEIDLFSVLLDTDFTDCDEATSLLALLFGNSEITDSGRRTLSTLSGTWMADPGNGYIFPCTATGIFPRTSTQESEYILFLDPSPGGSDGIRRSRSQLESAGWTFELG